MGVESMLLALSMELALKAWFVFDFDDPEHSKSHDLDKLFGKLKSESQEKLDQEFKRSVAPYYPNCLYVDYGIRHVLFQHKDAFTVNRRRNGTPYRLSKRSPPSGCNG